MEPGAGHESAFIADAAIEHKAVRAQRHQAGDLSSRHGEMNTVAARGGLDPDLTAEDEQEPLLGSPHADRDRRDRKDDADDDDESPGRRDFEGFSWYKRPSIIWVLIPFSVLAIAFGGILAPRVNLIMNLICRDYLKEQMSTNPGFIATPVSLNGSNPQCDIPEVSERAALFTLYGNLIAGLLSAFTSPKLGALSDRFGRTKLIAITSIGTLSADVFTILAATRPDKVSVNWILVGFAFDGLCGSFTTAFAIVHAYATDCTPPSQRNVAFAYFHGCLFTGIAIGPVLAGVLTKKTGTPVTSFYVMLVVHVFFIFFMAFATPESLSKRRQEQAREKHRVAKSQRSSDWIETLREINIIEPLKILWPSGSDVSPAIRRNLVLLASIDTMMFGVAMGSMTVILIYVRQVFGWETYESGVMMSIVNTFRVLCLVVALPLLTRYFRGRPDPKRQKAGGADLFDLSIIRLAVFMDTVGYLGYCLASTGPMMIGAGVVAALGGMGSPTIQSSLTKHVPAERTGQLLGAMGLLHALARVVAPTVFNGIFAKTAKTFPQTVFVCLAATFGVAFVFTWFVKPNVTLENPTTTRQDEETVPLYHDEQ